MHPFIDKIEAKKQYFDLRNHLNVANKLKNQITEITFELKMIDEELFLCCQSSEANHGLSICYYLEKPQFWMRTKNLKYPDLFLLFSFELSTICKKLNLKSKTDILTEHKKIILALTNRQNFWWMS